MYQSASAFKPTVYRKEFTDTSMFHDPGSALGRKQDLTQAAGVYDGVVALMDATAANLGLSTRRSWKGAEVSYRLGCGDFPIVARLAVYDQLATLHVRVDDEALREKGVDPRKWRSQLEEVLASARCNDMHNPETIFKLVMV